MPSKVLKLLTFSGRSKTKRPVVVNVSSVESRYSSTWLDHSIMTAKAVRAASEISPIPGVHGIAEVMVCLLSAVKEVIQNDHALEDLVKDLIDVLLKIQKQARALSQEEAFANSGQSIVIQKCTAFNEILLDMLNDVNELKRLTSNGATRRALCSESIMDFVSRYQAKLQLEMNTFAIQGIVNIDSTLLRQQTAVNEVSTKTDLVLSKIQLLTKTEELEAAIPELQNYCPLRLGEVEKIDPIAECFLYSEYTAICRGSNSTLRIYTGAQAAENWLKDIKKYSRTSSLPRIWQLLGYMTSNKLYATVFYNHLEDPCLYFDTLPVFERFIAMFELELELQATNGIISDYSREISPSTILWDRGPTPSRHVHNMLRRNERGRLVIVLEPVLVYFIRRAAHRNIPLSRENTIQTLQKAIISTGKLPTSELKNLKQGLYTMIMTLMDFPLNPLEFFTRFRAISHHALVPLNEAVPAPCHQVEKNTSFWHGRYIDDNPKILIEYQMIYTQTSRIQWTTDSYSIPHIVPIEGKEFTRFTLLPYSNPLQVSGQFLDPSCHDVILDAIANFMFSLKGGETVFRRIPHINVMFTFLQSPSLRYIFMENAAHLHNRSLRAPSVLVSLDPSGHHAIEPWQWARYGIVCDGWQLSASFSRLRPFSELYTVLTDRLPILTPKRRSGVKAIPRFKRSMSAERQSRPPDRRVLFDNDFHHLFCCDVCVCALDRTLIQPWGHPFTSSFATGLRRKRSCSLDSVERMYRRLREVRDFLALTPNRLLVDPPREIFPRDDPIDAPRITHNIFFDSVSLHSDRGL